MISCCAAAGRVAACSAGGVLHLCQSDTRRLRCASCYVASPLVTSTLACSYDGLYAVIKCGREPSQGDGPLICRYGGAGWLAWTGASAYEC